MLSSACKQRMVLLTKNTCAAPCLHLTDIFDITGQMSVVKQTDLGVKDPFVSNLLTGSVCCNYRSVSKGQAHLLNILHIYGSLTHHLSDIQNVEENKYLSVFVYMILMSNISLSYHRS